MKMDISEFCVKLEQLLEAPPGTIRAETQLSAIDEWDSMAVIGFIAMADADYGVVVSPQRLSTCNTVADLATLIAETAGAKTQ
jgi:acyl carrier protein